MKEIEKLFATPGAILPKICDWIIKTMKAMPDLKTIGNRFQFPLFRHRVKALPELNARK